VKLECGGRWVPLERERPLIVWRRTTRVWGLLLHCGCPFGVLHPTRSVRVPVAFPAVCSVSPLVAADPAPLAPGECATAATATAATAAANGMAFATALLARPPGVGSLPCRKRPRRRGSACPTSPPCVPAPQPAGIQGRHGPRRLTVSARFRFDRPPPRCGRHGARPNVLGGRHGAVAEQMTSPRFAVCRSAAT